ncbi:WecB/TagA/CpsF family glycosyltransferase [Massilia cellulosiltytica]|uniref:WecB/TagA/CpsF family glycosyltransferase n=1 Tax=Massilia TaxID=149698 RepID=UPI000A5CB354|nr:WecB/TagA/CpsF family glycosyltransferase [Massilia sp. Root1485]
MQPSVKLSEVRGKMLNVVEEETLFGVKFNALTMDGLMESIDSDLSKNRSITLAFSNPEFIIEAQRNGFLRDYLNRVNYNLADGIGVVAASRLLGKGLPERVTGTDFVYRMAEFCAHHSHSLFLFGGRPGVAAAAKGELEKAYPGIKIVGTVDGYINDLDKVVEEVNRVKPTFLMVCLGNPIQEQWISAHRDLLEAKVVFGNGGALDFCSGRVKRAPRWMQRLALEWLYRLRTDFSVKRIRRQARLSSYVWWVFQQFVKRQLSGQRSGS